MKKRQTLILNDKDAVLINRDGISRLISKPGQLADVDPLSVVLILNCSELDIARIELPKMSWLDRIQFIRTRRKHTSNAIFQGSYLKSNSLVEFRCPQTNEIIHWVEELIKYGHRISTIKPLVLKPSATSGDQITLVITDHQTNGLRQTAFQRDIPLFTRTTESHMDDIRTTLTYIKNHLHPTEIILEAFLESHLLKELLALNDPQVNLQRLQERSMLDQNLIGQTRNPYKFETPTLLKGHLRKHRLNQTAAGGLVALLFLSASAYWQYQQIRTLSGQESELIKLQQSQQIVLDQLPVETTLPTSHKKLAENKGPISLFERMATCLPAGLRASQIKWQNSATEETCEIELAVIDPKLELSDSVALIQKFNTSLGKELQGYESKILSLPHQSGEHEIFSGSTSSQDLVLSGEAIKAKLVVVGKK